MNNTTEHGYALPGLRNRPYIGTVTGRRFYLDTPCWCSVDIADMAWSLGRTPRFNGHTVGEPYSVAQHSVLVADNVPGSMRLEALLHDAHEYVTGDVSSPVGKRLPHLPPLKSAVQRAVHESLGMMYPPLEFVSQTVKEADVRAFVTEYRDILTPEYRESIPLQGTDGLGPFPEKVKPWPWPIAAERFHYELVRELSRRGL